MGKVECVKTGEQRTDLKWEYGRRKPKKADGTSMRVAVRKVRGMRIGASERRISFERFGKARKL